MNLTLCLTHDCNLACRYCYAGRARPSAMSDETVDAALALAFSDERPRNQIGFFGGEALLEWGSLQRATEGALRLAAERGKAATFTVTTNGSLLDDEKLAFLAAHAFKVGISLDGNQAMHDCCRRKRDGSSSYEACLRGFRRARSIWPDVEVITVVDPRNLHHLVEGVRHLCDEEDLRCLSLNPNFAAAWDEGSLARWEAAYEALADWWIERFRADRPLVLNVFDAKIITRLKRGFEPCDLCSFAEGEIAVAPSGRLYPCERLVGEDEDESWVMGDVFSGIDLSRQGCFVGCRGNADPECEDCALLSRCMHWCGAINISLSGRPDRTGESLCFHERIAAKAADRAAATLYGEGNRCFLEAFYGEGAREEEEKERGKESEKSSA